MPADDLTEMLKISVNHRVKINPDHDGNPDLLGIWQQCDDTVEKINSALLSVAALAHANTTNMEMKDTPALGELLQA